MGLLHRRASSLGNPFRDNSTAMLVSTLFFVVPVFLLLLHCAYHTLNRGYAPWGMTHGYLQDHVLSESFLYVASYSGVVTTLNITGVRHQGGAVVILPPVSTTEGCAGSPSWLALAGRDSLLYCLDEGLKDGKNGSLVSFRANRDGSLAPLDKVSTVFGPVSASSYGDRGHSLVVAHYGGSALSTWDVRDPAKISPIQVQEFELAKPGPNPSRQEAPHPHAAVVDPSGRFVLVPDLGADLIRVYLVDHAGPGLIELGPLAVAAGSGPRHIAFAVKHKTFMYVVTELGNTIVGYEVAYGQDSIAFEEIWKSGVHGKDKDVPEGAAASEVVVSPDMRFLILSSRNENTLEVPNFDPSNTTSIVSDPLVNFEIDAETGHLNLRQEVPCGGGFPRQFTINKAGTLVVVALQSDGRVVVMERDVKTGLLGKFVAYAEVEGGVTAVVFNE
ncbi:hypothetical protein NCS57_00248600 [Fusarium keratoplasticum]|uniref:Uncharacterized protein n=1 Tax=Fusarium keratoplasticum TaxID=1328300 RepID=A0ACC0R8F7_9HYPO|nr:hypothetical protein NCS57_00248600 [Fusarium keratoplasticum]KAI8679701.1 hypothetical protein NCS57_00248600 [Fusarium keratoplasticum]